MKDKFRKAHMPTGWNPLSAYTFHKQKEERVVYCQDLLLMGQDEHFWENIITGDETWCFAYDPATKRQSAE